MVERTSQPLQLASGNLGQFGGYRPGQARAEQVQEEPSLGMQALSGLLKIGGQVAEQAFNTSVKEAYMQGQRARMLGKSLEDEDADVLAKPFVRGGYQDQDYRIKQAELQQKMTAFIADKGRTLPPEQFVAELARESSAVLESMGDGLSNVGREQALMAQTQLEETLIGAHGKANRAYGIEQMGLRITTEGNAIVAQIGQARASGDDTLVAESAARASLFLEGIRTNSAMPDEDMRNEITLGFVKHLLAPGNDNRDVVESLLQSGQLDNLPGEKRAQINDWLYASQGRTVARDNLTSMLDEASFEKRVTSRLAGSTDAPYGEPVSKAEIDAWAANAAARRTHTDDQIRTRYTQWLNSTNDGQRTNDLIQAWVAGDVQKVYSLGSDMQKAASAYFKLGASQNVPLSTMIPAMTGMGLRIGMVPSEVTTNVNSSLRAMLLNPEQANPEQLGILSAYLDTARASSATNASAESTIIGALDRDLQPIVSRMLVDQRVGVSPVESLRNAAAEQAAWERLTPEDRTAKTKAMQKAVAEHLTPGWFQNAWAAIDPTQSRVQTDSPEFARMAEAVSQQAIALSYQPQYAGYKPEVLAKMAETMVAGRTIELTPEGGAASRLVVPEGAVALYGLSTPDDRARFGAAVSDLYGKKQAGAQASFLTQGGVLKVQYTVDGTPGPAKPIDPERVKARIKEMELDAINANIAPVRGEDYKIGDGASIRVNGDSASQLPRKLVMDFRKQLLRDEDVRLTAYPDRTADGTLVGVAVGVGQNVTGKLKPGDKITPAQAELWFKESSDAALLAAEREARDWGVTSPDQIAAMGLALFQMGPGGLSDFKNAKAAYQAGDWQKFESEVRKSKWYQQTPQRVETFLNKFKVGVDPAVAQHWMQR